MGNKSKTTTPTTPTTDASANASPVDPPVVVEATAKRTRVKSAATLIQERIRAAKGDRVSAAKARDARVAAAYRVYQDAKADAWLEYAKVIGE